LIFPRGQFRFFALKRLRYMSALFRGEDGRMGDANPPPAAPRDAVVVPPDATANAMSQLFREHNRVLVAYLTTRLRSEQEAKEVAQEAFLRLLELQGPCAPIVLRAYLFKTASNLAFDRLRHRRVQLRSEEQPEFFQDLDSTRREAHDPAMELLAREQTEQLLGLVRELPSKCQQVLSMHRLEGCSQHEVAERLAISDRMVRRYVTYAMLYLHLRLDGMAIDQVLEKVTL